MEIGPRGRDKAGRQQRRDAGGVGGLGPGAQAGQPQVVMREERGGREQLGAEAARAELRGQGSTYLARPEAALGRSGQSSAR